MKGAKAGPRARAAQAVQPHASSGRSKQDKAAVILEQSNRNEHLDEEDEEEELEEVPIRKPFRLLDLPLELRLKIYEEVLVVNQILDLNPLNFFSILPRLSILRTCRQVHEEAYRVFYSQPLYLFPTNGRFFHNKKPLLSRLPIHYRQAVYKVAWRIGPGWGKPPKNQNISPALGLADCINLRTLKIFVECDPSDNIFAGFRGAGATEDTYKFFCINLLLGIFQQVPSLHTVEIDAYPSVKKDSPIVLGLRRHIERAGKSLTWGPLRGWDLESDEPGLLGLESALASIHLSAAPKLVEMPA